MLQEFDSIDLALDAQPRESLPPAHSRERLWLKASVAIHFVVRFIFLLLHSGVLMCCARAGWHVGAHG